MSANKIIRDLQSEPLDECKERYGYTLEEFKKDICTNKTGREDLDREIGLLIVKIKNLCLQ